MKKKNKTVKLDVWDELVKLMTNVISTVIECPVLCQIPSVLTVSVYVLRCINTLVMNVFPVIAVSFVLFFFFVLHFSTVSFQFLFGKSTGKSKKKKIE